MNTGVYTFLSQYFIFFRCISRSGLLDHILHLFKHVNWRIITLQYCGGFCHHQHEQVIGIHCGFHLHFPDDQWSSTSFIVPVGLLYVFCEKMSIQILCFFFNWISFYLSCMSSLYFMDINPLQEYDLHIFSSIQQVGFFTLLMVSFAVQKHGLTQFLL